jgi:hypothetical protein
MSFYIESRDFKNGSGPERILYPRENTGFPAVVHTTKTSDRNQLIYLTVTSRPRRDGGGKLSGAALS